MTSRGFETETFETDQALDGKFLISMPGMADSEFHRTVIFLCAHTADNAMGIIVNREAENFDFGELMEQLSLSDSSDATTCRTTPLVVVNGGPVERGRGFVLHSSEYSIKDETLSIGPGVALTATVEILRAIAEGNGPEDTILALGYSGWGAGQLDREIQANGWLVCDVDPEIMFRASPASLYDHMMQNLGIEPGSLVPFTGHA